MFPFYFINNTIYINSKKYGESTPPCLIPQDNLKNSEDVDPHLIHVYPRSNQDSKVISKLVGTIFFH